MQVTISALTQPPWEALTIAPVTSDVRTRRRSLLSTNMVLLMPLLGHDKLWAPRAEKSMTIDFWDFSVQPAPFTGISIGVKPPAGAFSITFVTASRNVTVVHASTSKYMRNVYPPNNTIIQTSIQCHPSVSHRMGLKPYSLFYRHESYPTDTREWDGRVGFYLKPWRLEDRSSHRILNCELWSYMGINWSHLY